MYPLYEETSDDAISSGVSKNVTPFSDDGGYEITTATDDVLDAFDSIIGLDRLCAIHLNDSKNPLGAAKDRHEKIGEGFLGLEGITNIINNPRIAHLPFYLETPNELDGYAAEIALLKSQRK
jgi:deoxyribonuclease-4